MRDKIAKLYIDNCFAKSLLVVGNEAEEFADQILSLINAERCVWTKCSFSYGGGYNYKNCNGYEFKVHSYFEKHIYCPYCSKRIEVKDGR